ncbi:MAG: tyrosine-type recombinase/integrase [Thermovenabulum sp.]|uniref:site-specific integrase n=1 Tax=Thermovenabulum sp. TaxID=3100335 RepID=UPI003C7DF25A
MRGHIRKRGSTWTIVFYVDVNGKKKQKWIGGFKTKKEAEAALAEYIQKANAGEITLAKDITFADFLEKWIKNYCEANLAPRTLRRYSEIIRLYLIPRLGNIKLQDLRPFHIQQHYTWLLDKEEGPGLAPATALYQHRIIHEALKHAIRWQLIPRNPADAVEPPKARKTEINILAPAQIAELLNFLYQEKHILFIPTLLAATTGMRRGEICGLQWSDIDFERKCLYVRHQLQRIDGELVLRETKTAGSRRPVVLDDTTIELLKKHKIAQAEYRLMFGPEYEIANTNYVCTWPDGRLIDPDYITKAFTKVLDKINLPRVRFHDLRHTHATLLLQEGVNPKIVSERLGHTDIRITLNTYSHVLPSMQKEAANKVAKKIFGKV